MHQISSKVGSPKSRTPKIDRLEGEYQQNQERIRQLHRRNRDLAEQMREFQQDALPTRLIAQRIPLRNRRPRSLAQSVVGTLDQLSRIRIGRYPLNFWLKAAVMMVVVAVVCGSLGFMMTRLIGLLIGG